MVDGVGQYPVRYLQYLFWASVPLFLIFLLRTYSTVHGLAGRPHGLPPALHGWWSPCWFQLGWPCGVWMHWSLDSGDSGDGPRKRNELVLRAGGGQGGTREVSGGETVR